MRHSIPILVQFVAVVLLVAGQLSTIAENQPELYGKIQWGEFTNQISAGLLPEVRRVVPDGMRVRIHVFLRNENTNSVTFILPNMLQRFHLKVYDGQGKEPAKTRMGSAHGKPLPKTKTITPQTRRDLKTVYLGPREISWLTEIDLCEYFRIKRGTIYYIEFEQRLYTYGSLGILNCLSLPVAKAELQTPQ